MARSSDKQKYGRRVSAKGYAKIFHLLLDCEKVEQKRIEIELYFLRRFIETDKKLKDKVYIASLSTRTMVYKGMFVAPQLDVFYPELLDERIESSFIRGTLQIPCPIGSWHNLLVIWHTMVK